MTPSDDDQLGAWDGATVHGDPRDRITNQDERPRPRQYPVLLTEQELRALAGVASAVWEGRDPDASVFGNRSAFARASAKLDRAVRQQDGYSDAENPGIGS